MIKEEKYHQLFDYTLKLLARRPRSKSEIVVKINKYSQGKKFPKQLIDQVINELIARGLINDEEFTKWWIEQRNTFRPKGKLAMMNELLTKGVETGVIEKALDDSGFSTTTEMDLALRVIEKKRRLYETLPNRQKEIKLAQLLKRRGFHWQTINKVIDVVLEKT